MVINPNGRQKRHTSRINPDHERITTMTRTLIASLIAIAALAPTAQAGILDAAETAPQATLCDANTAKAERRNIDCTTTQSVTTETPATKSYPSAPQNFAPGIVF